MRTLLLFGFVSASCGLASVGCTSEPCELTCWSSCTDLVTVTCGEGCPTGYREFRPTCGVDGGTQDSGPTPDDGGPTPDDGGPTPDDGGPTPDDGGPIMTDGGPMMTDGGPMMTDAGSPSDDGGAADGGM